MKNETGLSVGIFGDIAERMRRIRDKSDVASEAGKEVASSSGGEAEPQDDAEAVTSMAVNVTGPDSGMEGKGKGVAGVEGVADRVAAWLDRLVERRRVTEDEAVGMGLLIWYRSGGEQVEYRHPLAVLDDRFLPRRWRGERAAFAGLAAGRFPSAVTCVRDDEQGRPFWVPTMRAGELLERELAKDRRAGRIAA